MQAETVTLMPPAIPSRFTTAAANVPLTNAHLIQFIVFSHFPSIHVVARP